MLNQYEQIWTNIGEPIFSSFVGLAVLETDSELNLYISGQPKTWRLLSFRYQRSHAIWSKTPIGFSANALEGKYYEHFGHWTFFFLIYFTTIIFFSGNSEFHSSPFYILRMCRWFVFINNLIDCCCCKTQHLYSFMPRCTRELGLETDRDEPKPVWIQELNVWPCKERPWMFAVSSRVPLNGDALP